MSYFGLVAIFLATFFVTLILVLITYIFSNRGRNFYAEKVSPYECGFEPFHSARRQFSVNFYNYALLFLLFDVELVMLLPAISTLGYLPAIGRHWFFLFLMILGIGFIYEVSVDALYIEKGLMKKWHQ